MNTVTLALCAAGWIVAALVVALLPTRIHRRHLRRALQLRTAVRPYLHRRAVEAGLEVGDAPGAGADAIFDDICDLAEALTRHERAAASPVVTIDTLAVSDTQPMVTPEETRRP
jgi:hypothetical protein